MPAGQFGPKLAFKCLAAFHPWLPLKRSSRRSRIWLRWLRFESLVLVDDADDKIKDAPHLLGKMCIDVQSENKPEQEVKRLRGLLNRASQAKDAAQKGEDVPTPELPEPAEAL